MKYFSNGEEIKQHHINIAIELFKWIDEQRKTKNQRPMTYKELGDEVYLNPQGLGPYLGALSTECKAHDLPLISAIVVNKKTQIPHPQFWIMAQRIGCIDIDIVLEQQRVFAQIDWQSLKVQLGLE